MKTKIETVWNDRKRILGMPLSFTKYSVSKDRLFRQKGFFNIKFEEILLYRISDISLKMNLWQRIFGVGTVLVHSSDKTTPHFELVNVRHPIDVKELLHSQVEEMKLARRVYLSERIDSNLDNDCCDDMDDLD